MSQPALEITPELADLGLMGERFSATSVEPYEARSSKATLLILSCAVALSGLSWLADGLPALTDMAIVIVTAICLLEIVRELRNFTRRYGMGALTFYAGCLSWYSIDYITYWFQADYTATVFPAWVVAKQACLYCLLVWGTTMGLNVQRGDRMAQRLLRLIPEMPSNNAFLGLTLLMSIVGVMPYFFFVSEPFYVAILKDMFNLRSETGASWTIARTGNANTSFGAYILMVPKLGQLSAIMAVLYAVWITRSVPARILCGAIFVFWFMLAFGTGTRGAIIYLMIPSMAFVFLRYHAQTASLLRRFSLRAYVTVGLLGLVTLVVVQFQGTFRGQEFTRTSWRQVDLAGNSSDNGMFSSGLRAVQLVPSQQHFFANAFPGAGIAQMAVREPYLLAISPIPRALWPNKPLDDSVAWYNGAYGGDSASVEGTTIAPGITAGIYMCYGLPASAVFAIFYGWLLGLTERSLRMSFDQPMHIVFVMATFAIFFATFRSWQPIHFVTLALPVVGYCVLAWPLCWFLPKKQQV